MFPQPFKAGTFQRKKPILFSDKRLKNRCRWKIPQNKAEDAGILTDSEDDNAVMRNFTRQMLKDFIRE